MGLFKIGSKIHCPSEKNKRKMGFNLDKFTAKHWGAKKENIKDSIKKDLGDIIPEIKTDNKIDLTSNKKMFLMLGVGISALVLFLPKLFKKKKSKY